MITLAQKVFIYSFLATIFWSPCVYSNSQPKLLKTPFLYPVSAADAIHQQSHIVGVFPPNMLAIDPPRKVLNSEISQPFFPFGNPGISQDNSGFQPINMQLGDTGAPVLGSECLANSSCTKVPNSYCSPNKTCKCLPSFMEDPQFPGTCRLGPGYNEPCSGIGEFECRPPFTCNSTNLCDCPVGTIQEYFQCVKDCPYGQIPIDNKCYPAKHLEESCRVDEQCVQSYAQCLHGKCQCIPGANQIKGNCFPVNQCPLGEPAADSKGQMIKCKIDKKMHCPEDYYCLYPEFTESLGFCCPKIKMNCPIGKPLEGKNCSNCPWESHHCFSYVIGTYNENMCCPNACPASQPIQKKGRCYPRSAFAGNCMVDEQCYSVVDAVCRDPNGNTESKNKKCMCPIGSYQNFNGKCIRESGLGEECSRNEECKMGTNTVCLNKICTCYQGYMPEPLISSQTIAQKCIAKPSCPTAAGVQTIESSYEDCSHSAAVCSSEEFCRKWWFEGNKTFSLCCPKPKLSDYESICTPFRMNLLLIEAPSDINRNSTDDSESEQLIPIHCDIASAYPQQFSSISLGFSPGGPNSTSQFCPGDSSCIFDPFSINRGVCCQPPQLKPPPSKEVKPNLGESKISSISKVEAGGGKQSRIHVIPIPEENKIPLQRNPEENGRRSVPMIRVRSRAEKGRKPL